MEMVSHLAMITWFVHVSQVYWGFNNYFVYGRNLVCLFWLFHSSLVRIVPAVYCYCGCWLFMANVLQKREVFL